VRVCTKVVTFAVVRVGVPSWCTCGGCVPETVVKKQVCCLRSPEECWCVTEAFPLNDAVLNLVDDDITQEGSVFTTTAPPDSIALATPAQKRLLCYRIFFRIFHGIGSVGNQVDLPSCVRKSVATTYPDV